jgi:hypothetical protein
MEKVAPEYQAQPYTTEISKKIALGLARTGIHVSPLKLDNALFGYTGGFGRLIAQAANPALHTGASPPSTVPADIPMVRGFVVRQPGGDAQSVQEFYDRYTELDQKYNTLRFNQKYPGRAAGAEKMTPTEVEEYLRMRIAYKILEQVGQAVRMVYSSDATPEEKRRRIQNGYSLMIRTARAALGKGSQSAR